MSTVNVSIDRKDRFSWTSEITLKKNHQNEIALHHKGYVANMTKYNTDILLLFSPLLSIVNNYSTLSSFRVKKKESVCLVFVFKCNKICRIRNAFTSLFFFRS